MRGRGMPVPKGAIKKGTLSRLLKLVWQHYRWQMIVVLICIVLNACGTLISSLFVKTLTDDIIAEGVRSGLSSVKAELIGLMIAMIIAYGIVVWAGFFWHRIMATVTQGILYHVRRDIFEKMQTLRVPTLLSCSMTLIVSVVFMLSFSLWLFLVVVVCTFAMTFVVKKIGGNSAKYMVAQQRSLAEEEGFVEEMIKGQKVVKVFTHEEQAKADFNIRNEKLFQDSSRAHIFGNILGPILGNIGNFTYVLLAIVGGLLYTFEAPNIALSSIFTGIQVLSIGTILSFLGMSRNFTMTINQMSQQISMIAMGLAGARRVFTLMDEEAEQDDGYVTLVNAKKDENGNLVETQERTGLWAWKHFHKADGTTTYTELRGDIVMEGVDFGYVPEKQVLSDVSLYAKPGQKIAFVGATGAGKTTITNLINRFYDIADGKIRYDGININKIRKSDLRRSLGIVLQDVNLFTGTVMDNIRYGRLDATDEECIAAAKLANADDFICRLPDGYQTMLKNNGANLSQGQRQLLSIARAAVADAPAMILDEATSSIDTRTEALVNDGMDKLMHGRTVFVIAHRLSTVRNSDAIMVLDHGRIIERGTHEQLLEQKGTYYQLYTGVFELE